MDVTTLLTGSRWDLLELLADKPQSTSQLAKKLGTSQANVSQQLKQLELAGFITRVRTEKSRIHYVYEIHEDMLHMTLLGPRSALKKTLRSTDLERFFIGLLLHKHGIPLLTFFLSRPDLTTRFRAIGILARDRPEMFVLAEQVDDIRREHANIPVKTIAGEKNIVTWSHTEKEVAEGLAHGDRYFYDVLDGIDLLYDPEGTIMEFKKQVERQG